MGVILDTQGRLFNSELRPARASDGGATGQVLARGNAYGEGIVQVSTMSKAQLAAEGSYFTTPGSVTPGTKLALGAAQVAFTDTIPIAYFQNNEPFGPTGKKAYLDFIDLIGLLPQTASTDALYFAIVTDVIRGFTTDNMTTNLVPVPANTDLNAAASLQVKIQSNAANSAIAASAAQTKRVVAQGAIPRWVGVLGDSVRLVFGNWDAGDSVQGLTAAAVAQPGRFIMSLPPVVIGGNRSATLHLWQPGNTQAGQAAVVQVGHFER